MTHFERPRTFLAAATTCLDPPLIGRSGGICLKKTESVLVAVLLVVLESPMHEIVGKAWVVEAPHPYVASVSSHVPTFHRALEIVSFVHCRFRGSAIIRMDHA